MSSADHAAKAERHTRTRRDNAPQLTHFERRSCRCVLQRRDMIRLFNLRRLLVPVIRAWYRFAAHGRRAEQRQYLKLVRLGLTREHGGYMGRHAQKSFWSFQRSRKRCVPCELALLWWWGRSVSAISSTAAWLLASCTACALSLSL